MTLTHYGINWDTINHLPRGQAYLNYFLTGSKDYSNLTEESPEFHWYWQKPQSLGIDTNLPKNEVPRRSMYQSYSVPYTYFIKKDGGHPPLSDIISAGFNRVLFGRLRLVNDIDSYRVYGVLLASVLVALVYFWVSGAYGKVAGIVAALALSSYPLFWAESHFNTEKDIPEAAYWGILMYSVWRGIRERSWKWLVFSGVAFGFALGTKFNVLFSALIIIPWTIFELFLTKKRPSKKTIIILIASAAAAILIGGVIFIGSWPYLWADPVSRIGQVVKFYKDIGTTSTVDARFAGPFGISFYPILWILYTTPEVVLALFAVGMIVLIYRIIKKRDSTALLFVLWFLVPIGRVVWPGASIYGGVRQIMEYIPAMAIIAGVGAGHIVAFFKNIKFKIAAAAVIAAGFVILILNLASIHPYENTYFNYVSGGLSRMKAINFPYWGFSFGTPYRQIVQWLNENVPEKGNLVFSYELTPNLPHIFLRSDINLYNANRSGYLRKGEYAISLIYQGTAERSYYDTYLDKFLKPVWEGTVDGVAIARIWKNSDEYLIDKRTSNLEKAAKYSVSDGVIRFDIGKEKDLSRLELSYSQAGCAEPDSLIVSTSRNGFVWDKVPGLLPRDWLIPFIGQQPKDGKFMEPFTGQRTRYIRLAYSPAGSCIEKITSFRVYTFGN